MFFTDVQFGVNFFMHLKHLAEMVWRPVNKEEFVKIWDKSRRVHAKAFALRSKNFQRPTCLACAITAVKSKF